MDEQTRRGRELDALEVIAEQLERLRVLKEYEIGAWGSRKSKGICTWSQSRSKKLLGRGILL
jgi:hypothetical protein